MPPKALTQIPPDLMDDRVLRYPEVKAVTGRSEDSIRRAAARKELKLTRLGPRQVGVRKSELRRWLDQRTG
jgi:predicted DNA-binding transcriptional regulator AlpA